MADLKFYRNGACVMGRKRASMAGKKKKYRNGDVLVIRYADPKAVPRMREMGRPPPPSMKGQAARLLITRALLWATEGFASGLLVLRPAIGGPDRPRRDGDIITIDAVNGHPRC